MSQTGPLGHSPVNLSTSMGLSDPRLRRALQLSQVMEQKLGFGLKLDSEGRLAVDSKSVAADSTTVNTLLKTLISSTSTTTNSFITNEFDESLLDQMLEGTDLYGWVEGPGGLNDAVGPGDWPDNSESIASYVLGVPRVTAPAPQAFTDVELRGGTGPGPFVGPMVNLASVSFPATGMEKVLAIYWDAVVTDITAVTGWGSNDEARVTGGIWLRKGDGTGIISQHLHPEFHGGAHSTGSSVSE
ncbi:MAG: hypothetical protein QF615_04000, partial [Planctomycetota bacterium]|nr:hypothetical protein [Planctomycetota bacterium]